MLNKIIIQGRLTDTPVMQQTASGVDVTTFTVAVERNYKNQDGNKQTDFINCVAWRNTAKFVCDYFSKGKMVIIAGALETRSYEDKNGNKRKAVEVIVSEVNFCGDKNNADQTTNSTGGNVADFFAEIDDDDIPF